MVTALQYQLLRRLRPSGASHLSGAAYKKNGRRSKLDILLGDLLQTVRGKVVIDFGCGYGDEAVELARRGAARVIGVDINQEYLREAQRRAEDAGLSQQVEFATRSEEPADVVVSLDSFEHFADPAETLSHMFDLLRPGGVLVASFGPTWYHPYGGHLFSVFPWAHLLFSERALIRWRSDHRFDNVQGFEEAGLNRMTVRRFLRIANSSRFTLEHLELVPIRHVKRLHNRLTREFFTAIIRCKFRKPAHEPGDQRR